nr:hypothetical protein [uncultured Sphingomonas sp.]
MWALISRRTQVMVLVGLTAFLLLGVQATIELWTGTQPSLFKVVSLVATIVGTVLVIVANWVWRWVWAALPFLNRTFFPDLNGEWEGLLITTWIDPATGQVPPPIMTNVTIRQGILSISVRQKTKESTSWSTRVIAEADVDADTYRIWYSYSNKPKASVSHRSCDHDGVAWLEVSLGDNPEELHGQYFTSRRTSGDIELRRVSSKP